MNGSIMTFVMLHGADVLFFCFFVKFMQPELLIKFPKLWMLLKKLPKLCWVVVDTVLQLLTRSRLSELWLVNITFGAGHRWIFWQKIYCWVKKFPSIFHSILGIKFPRLALCCEKLSTFALFCEMLSKIFIFEEDLVKYGLFWEKIEIFGVNKHQNQHFLS